MAYQIKEYGLQTHLCVVVVVPNKNINIIVNSTYKPAEPFI